MIQNVLNKKKQANIFIMLHSGADGELSLRKNESFKMIDLVHSIDKLPDLE